MLTEMLPTLQLPPDAPGQLLRELRDILEPGGLRVFGGLPRDGVLQGVRLDAIAAALGTRFIAGQRDLLDASAAEVRLCWPSEPGCHLSSVYHSRATASRARHARLCMTRHDMLCCHINRVSCDIQMGSTTPQ